MKLTIFLLTINLFFGCSQIMEKNNRDEIDLAPPSILSYLSVNSNSFVIKFDESVKGGDDFIITPDLGKLEIFSNGPEIKINHSVIQTPGTVYCVDGKISDASGNTLSFLLNVYGFNPDIPILLINEFTVQGSSTHPDAVEIISLSSGNLAGVCIYEGTKGNWDDCFIFPPLNIQKNDFIIVHFKPENIEVEINETENKAQSGGIDSYAEAWDFWVKDGDGLSGNNGVITLYSAPEGNLMDGILYSSRTSDSDVDYSGFGTRDVMLRAFELQEENGWETEGEKIRPEDGINPSDSTATRSICRSSASIDTNSKLDWHITPTSGFSFGRINNEGVYLKKVLK